MIYLCINLYKSVTKVGIIFYLCKKNLIFFKKNINFLSKSSFSGNFCIENAHFLGFVRLTGLEPARRETPDPKSDASTNSATGAFHHAFYRLLHLKRLQSYEYFFILPKFFGQIL